MILPAVNEAPTMTSVGSDSVISEKPTTSHSTHGVRPLIAPPSG